MANLFNQDMAKTYDAKNSALAPISDNLHFLIRMVLANLPRQARILCVGVGTGAEILSLAKEFPEWSLVGIDPSEAMLDICRMRLDEANILSRCELIHGYADDLSDKREFDAVLSILVAHFIRHEDRPAFYIPMLKHLKKGGIFVTADISFDLNSDEFPSMLENWSHIQHKMGATPESLQALPDILRHKLGVISPSETEKILHTCGILLPTRFFQAFMIVGWYGIKT